MDEFARPLLCLGLISGTSVDGIDAALVGITGSGGDAHLDLVAFATTPYPTAVREDLLGLYDDTTRAVARLCSLNVTVGECFARAALELCRDAGVEPAQLHVIGSHGQTVWHQPAPDPALPRSTASTFQIGEPAVIAERTGAPVVANFRAADMAAGGQGAPLAPYFDWVVLCHPTRGRAAQNIGGIGNVTYLPAGGERDAVRAFDTGPGNILIDGMVTLLSGGALTFDRDGELAAQGRVDPDLLADLLRDSYLGQPPPKTTGRERYGLAWCRRLIAATGLTEASLDQNDAARRRAIDLIAIVTAFTAHTIADSYRRWLPPVDEVIVSGGGSHNPTLMGLLAAALEPVPVVTAETYGIDSDAKEAMTFALLAHDALTGLPTNIPTATGATHPVILGSVTRGAGR